MSTYFIGDVHGCYDTLMQLLEKIQFNRQHDKLIFVGDLINRGPKSLEVLRFVKGLGKSAQMVLGNHDISFFAYALGVYHGRGSDFPEMAKAQDAEQLLAWLREQPLLIHDEASNVVVTHAGIPPRWSIAQAKKQARKAERKMRGKKWESYLRYAYGKSEDKWQDDFDKYDKFRYRLNGFTRLRYCDDSGEPDLRDKCPVGEQNKGLAPWFALRKKLQRDGKARLVFGHWAALGYHDDGQAICIDSGCAWGGKLTAISIENGSVIKAQVSAKQKR